MIETIAAVIGGGLAVYAAIVSKQKDKINGVFTIKSDKVTVDEVPLPGQGYQPTPRERPEAPPRPQSPSEAPTSYPNIESAVMQNMKSLDMSNVSGIRFQGTGDVHFDGDRLYVDDKASVYVKNQTLWIESKGNMIRISGNVYGANSSYSNTSMVEVPLKNINVSDFDRVSLKGAGDIKLSNMKIGKSLDIDLQGSGDIILNNISTGTLELNLNGSGDILVNKKCRATHTLASIKGSGDITIKSSTVGIVAKKIKGSGDINTPKRTSTTKNKSKSNKGYFSNTSSRTVYTSIHTSYE